MQTFLSGLPSSYFQYQHSYFRSGVLDYVSVSLANHSQQPGYRVSLSWRETCFCFLLSPKSLLVRGQAALWTANPLASQAKHPASQGRTGATGTQLSSADKHFRRGTLMNNTNGERWMRTLRAKTFGVCVCKVGISLCYGNTKPKIMLSYDVRADS